MSTDEGSSSKAVLLWPGLLAVVTVVGLFLPSQPYSVHAPKAPEIKEVTSEGSRNSFYAHAAEDPWLALGRDRAHPEKPGEAVRARTQYNNAHFYPAEYDPHKFKKVCILPVIVRDDQHSAEASEQRARYRVAVDAALGAAGYVADDPENLTLLSTMLSPHGPRVEMPAEWYIPYRLPRFRPNDYDGILVVWVPNRAVFNNPLTQLVQLKTFLENTVKGPRHIFCRKTNPPAQDLAEEIPDFSFKVIGPYWSGTLIDMLHEDRGDELKNSKLQIYSTSATVSDAIIEYIAQPKEHDNPARSMIAAKIGGGFHSFTCTDEQLASALLEELELRGVYPLDPDTRIAIVSDWTTEYGRATPLTFAALIQQQLNNRKRAQTLPPRLVKMRELDAESISRLNLDRDDDWPNQILRIHYLAGLSGIDSIEKERKTESAVADSSVKNGDGAPIKEIEVPEGTQQVDAIRRLSNSLALRIKEQAERGVGAGKLRAFGIFGSNVYDKLLLIEALRPLFPGVIFFTTDLDARLSYPSRLSFTRNLIVASSFGLELRSAYQRGVPPFRDSYQTAVFLGVQAAVDAREDISERARLSIEPQLFEITRSGPIRLRKVTDVDPPEPENALEWSSPLYPSSSRDEPRSTHHWAKTWRAVKLGVLAFVALGLLSVFVSYGTLGVLSRPVKNVAAIIGGLILVLLGWYWFFYDGIEPFNLSGASLWPSVFIRFIALILSICFFVHSQFSLRVRVTRLAKEFNLSTWPYKHSPFKGLQLTERVGAFYRAITHAAQPRRDYLHKRWDMLLPGRNRGNFKYKDRLEEIHERRLRRLKDESASCVDIDTIWHYTCENSQSVTRYSRMVFMVVLYLVVCMAILGFSGLPYRPFRGMMSNYIDNALSWLSGIGLLSLIAMVVSATHAAKRIIEKLSSPAPTCWKGASMKSKYASIPEMTTHPDAMSYYLDILFIGRLTAIANPLIYYPFIIVALLCFARLRFFADWHLNSVVVGIYCANVSICVICAMILRYQAVRAKQSALEELDLYISKMKKPQDLVAARSLRRFRDQIENNREGAFLPWTQQPMIHAVLIPIGGGGIIQILQMFKGG